MGATPAPGVASADVKTRDLAYIALFAAITAVLGLVPAVPVGPVPITAQTLGVMLAGSILGARRGFLSQLLFLVLVAAGLPLLASGTGGLAPFFGPYAGYILCWPLGAFVIGLLTERFWGRYNIAWGLVANLAGGVLLIDVVGAIVLGAVNNLSFWQAAMAGAIVFLPGDLIKAVIASVVAVQVRRSYPVIERPRRAVAVR
jgi:biotin transport system substrate-specific component